MATAELRARATLDASQFSSAMGGISGGMMKSIVGGNLLTQGIQKIARGLYEAAKEAIGFGKSMSDTAKNLGMTIESLTMFDRAAKLEGQTTDYMSQKFFKLADSQQEAIMGNKELQESFARLGVSMHELTTMDPGALMQAMASGAEKSATGIKDLNDILGRGAAQEMQDIFSRVRSGEGMSPITKEDIMALDNMQGALQRFATGFGEAKTKLGAGIATLFGFGASTEDVSRADAQQKAMAEKQRQGLKIAARGKLTKGIADETGKLETANYSGIKVSGISAADSMARIGAFSGGQADTSKQILERQEAIMKEQLRVSEANKDNLDKIREYTSALKALEE